MASKDFGEDIAFIMYLAPLVASIAYGAYEWLQIAHSSSTMPGRAYLIVSKSQYLFLVSVAVICIGIVVEVRTAGLTERPKVVQSNARRLQMAALAVLILSFAAALSAAHYNFGDAASIFIAGRYAIIFAFFLVGTSILLMPQEILGNFKLSSLPEILGLILLAISPLIFYGGVKVHMPFVGSASAALVIAVLGLVLLFRSVTTSKSKNAKPVETVTQNT